VADSYENNESSGCTKGGELLDCLSDYQLLKKDSAARRWQGLNNLASRETVAELERKLSEWSWLTGQHIL
jgi:hypothetical protein